MESIAVIRTTAALCAAFLGAAVAMGTAYPVDAAPAYRPAITGVSHLAVYATDAAASEHFYAVILGARKGVDPENSAGTRYYLSSQQFVEVLPAPVNHGASMLAHVAYNTTDAADLRAYFAAHGVLGAGDLHHSAEETWFSIRDPEGNEVQFVQPAKAATEAIPAAISDRIIHVGYLVRDRAKEDGFYRALLGFRPYWFGAFKPDKVDWVSQQVPDGHDWLEYMMVGPTSDVSLDKVDAHELGVLNHVSLGVPNMESAMTKLIAENRLSPRHDGPQMGLDGKWQANLYDPDGTRIELMEFEPVTKPCCSAFTAKSPTR
jgi:catechol 2,3-dioxygenase-like lactoylglutathione lyase family enzyme